MKHIFKIVVMLGLLAASPPLIADPEPAPKISLIYVANSDWNIDWEGTPNRIYFVQASLDLENWMFAQSIKFGTGLKTMGVNSDNAPNFFVRLAYIDDPSVTSLSEAQSADSDFDMLSNLAELTIHNSNPLDSDDPGGDDELPNLFEHSIGSSPLFGYVIGAPDSSLELFLPSE